LTIAVTEGKHRMVRRMLNNCGHPVLELRRVQFGEVKLGGLKEGEFRFLTEEEEGWVQGLNNQEWQN
jgi:23S rRNA pseudouridine2605 synthase